MGDDIIRPSLSPLEFLHTDLTTPRLNNIHQYLWLAAYPGHASPLHRQKLVGRSLLITEDPNEHLVWYEKHIFIKPLPVYLLDYGYWEEYICPHEELFQSACGLLRSFAWLICHECDFNIAKDEGLIPKDLEWPDWIQFMNHIDLERLGEPNKRYLYGELPLTRLNIIHWFKVPSYMQPNFVNGYNSGMTWYDAYFQRQYRLLLAVFGIFSIALSALQVGLATTALQSNHSFQDASYGFTIAAIFTLVVCVSKLFPTWFVLICYEFLRSLLSTYKFVQRYQRNVGSYRTA